MANTNNANPNITAGNDEPDILSVLTKGVIDTLMSGFGKGAALMALAIVAVPTLIGAGLASNVSSGLMYNGQAASPLMGAIAGAGAGGGFLAMPPGWIAMALAGLVGSYVSWQSNKQTTVAANIAQQNADLKSQLEDYHQQNVTVQVDQQPGRANWNHRPQEQQPAVEVHPGYVAKEEQRRAAVAAQAADPNLQGVRNV